MKQLFLLLIFVVSISILIFGQAQKTKTFERIVNKNLPNFTFVVTDISPDSLHNYERLFRIDIYNSKKFLQTFQHHTSMGNEYFLDINFFGNELGHESDTNLVDINFDGYNDLIFLNSSGVGGNFNYDTYLFDKKDNKFHKNENFSSMINISINKTDQTISEYISEGCYSNCYTIKTYKIKNNLPILVKEEVQYAVDGDLNNIMNETYHFKNGKKFKVKSHKFQFN
jgi:hypothetical protein